MHRSSWVLTLLEPRSFLPSPPSLQSWGNNTNDQCSLASKSVSLDLFLAAGGASPRRSNTFSRASPGRAARAEPEQTVSLQQPVAEAVKGSEDAVSAAKQAQAESSPALHPGDNAPAFWEGRRRSSSSSSHVHGSSAALSALAQAYSRAGQGRPGACPGCPGGPRLSSWRPASAAPWKPLSCCGSWR